MAHVLCLLFLLREVSSAAWMLNTSQPSVPQQSSRDNFAGVDWKKSEAACSSEQLAILEEATRVVAYDMLQSAIDVPIEGNQDWNRFFMNNAEATSGQGWTGNTDHEAVFNKIITNIRWAYFFVLEGKKKETVQTTKKLVYACPESEPVFCPPGVVAYTLRGPSLGDDLPTLTLCPTFWDRDHIEKLGSQPDLAPGDLKSIRLSYEHVLIHELFHLDFIGFDPDIDDLSATLSPFDSHQVETPIYGAINCHKFAWALASDNVATKSVNTKVAQNADNYAFFFTSFWLSAHHDWSRFDGKGDI